MEPDKVIDTVVGTAFLYGFGIVIWGIVAYMLVKPFLRWLLKPITAGIRANNANEQSILDVLNAEPLDTKRQGGFIVTDKDDFAVLDAKTADSPAVRKQFETCCCYSMVATQDWDYDYGRRHGIQYGDHKKNGG